MSRIQGVERCAPEQNKCPRDAKLTQHRFDAGHLRGLATDREWVQQDQALTRTTLRQQNMVLKFQNHIPTC